MFIPTPMKKTHAYLYRDVGESKEKTPSRKQSKHAPPLRDVSNVSGDTVQQKQKASLKSADADKSPNNDLRDFLLKLKLKTGDDGAVVSVWTKRYFFVKENERGPILFYAKDESSDPAGCECAAMCGSLFLLHLETSVTDTVWCLLT